MKLDKKLELKKRLETAFWEIRTQQKVSRILALYVCFVIRIEDSKVCKNFEINGEFLKIFKFKIKLEKEETKFLIAI